MKILASAVTRWVLAILMLALLAGLVAACNSSDSPTTEPSDTPSSAQPTTAVNVALEHSGEGDSTGTSQPAFAPTPDASPMSPNHAEEANAESSQARENSTDPTPSLGDNPAGLMLAAFEEVLSGIYESAVPSVVYIRAPNADASAFRGMPGIPDDLLWSAGSGFIWDNEGHIVTNHHVIENAVGDSQPVTVIFSDSTQAKGRVVGSDPHSDLAVIKLEEGEWDLNPAILGDSSSVRVGQLAVAIGAPFGQEFTMTSGIVSAVGRNISGQGQFTIPEVIQTDSAINPGNSGGPLLDRLGQVIGINTQIISRTGSFSGIGMAVPVNIAKRVVPPLIADGEFNYPWLGISIAEINAEYAEALDLPKDTRGALIISTVDDSPADKAGLRGSESSIEVDGIELPSGGDIIQSISDHPISSPNDLIAHLTYHNSPEDTVSLVILRDGQRQEVEVTLGERPRTP